MVRKETGNLGRARPGPALGTCEAERNGRADPQSRPRRRAPWGGRCPQQTAGGGRGASRHGRRSPPAQHPSCSVPPACGLVSPSRLSGSAHGHVSGATVQLTAGRRCHSSRRGRGSEGRPQPGAPPERAWPGLGAPHLHFPASPFTDMLLLLPAHVPAVSFRPLWPFKPPTPPASVHGAESWVESGHRSGQDQPWASVPGGCPPLPPSCRRTAQLSPRKPALPKDAGAIRTVSG